MRRNSRTASTRREAQDSRSAGGLLERWLPAPISAALDAYLRTPAGSAAYQASLRADAPNGVTAQAGVLAGARALRAAKAEDAAKLTI